MIKIDLDYKSIKSSETPISICLGYFDGLHLGHISIINEAKKRSEYPLSVLSFDKPISKLIDNHKSKEVLTSIKDREIYLNRLGMDYLYIINIDKDFINLSPESFIEILKKINVKHVFVGKDFTFGKDAKGDVKLLKKFFKVDVVDILTKEGEKVSTQNIISLIKDGNISKANTLLGRAYQISGTIIKGHGLGKSIGFPTANIKLSDEYVLPKFGVYKTLAYISGIPHISITNVGIHPTVNKENKPLIEVHIPNYIGEDYDKTIYLEFIDFIREERKFDSLEELKIQISNDIKTILC